MTYTSFRPQYLHPIKMINFREFGKFYLCSGKIICAKIQGEVNSRNLFFIVFLHKNNGQLLCLGLPLF